MDGLEFMKQEWSDVYCCILPEALPMKLQYFRCIHEACAPSYLAIFPTITAICRATPYTGSTNICSRTERMEFFSSSDIVLKFKRNCIAFFGSVLLKYFSSFDYTSTLDKSLILSNAYFGAVFLQYLSIPFLRYSTLCNRIPAALVRSPARTWNGFSNN